MHEGKGLLHTSLFYQAATDLYKRTNLRCCSNRIDDDYADRAVAPLPSGDRRLVDARIKRGPRREINRYRLGQGCRRFPVGLTSPNCCPTMRRKNLLWPPRIVKSVNSFALGQS